MQRHSLLKIKDEKLTIAYLDPGAGSLILQLFVGGFSGFVVFVRYLVKHWYH